MDKESNNFEVLEISVIMKSASGRSWVSKLLTRSGVFQKTFDKDPIEHAYCAGRRELGLEIYNQMKELAPDEFKLMMRENYDA
jgi:hypothetical protein